MYLKFERALLAIVFLVTMVATGCDSASGPTSAMDEGSDLELAQTELAFGKKPVPTEVSTPVNQVGDLIAGQHHVVGKVYIDLDATDLTIRYETNSDWCLTSTHVYVGEDKPATSAPGQFPYGKDALSCVGDWDTTIDVSGLGSPLWIAVHGVVEGVGADSAVLEASWAGMVNVTYTRGPAWTQETYFDVTVGNWGDLSGTYKGWCADADKNASLGTLYNAYAYSTYDPLFPIGLVEHPENLDLLNYLLNQVYVGTESTGNGPFTYGDVQRAIWLLIDDSVSDSGLGDWDQNRVDEILAAVWANGEDFVPACGQVYGVIFQPVDEFGATVAQLSLIPLPVPCGGDGDETAWGQGYVGGLINGMWQFGTGWGWYFPFPSPTS